MQKRTALLIGASGLVGGHLLRLLVEDEACTRVIALVRRPLSFRHPKLHERVVDFGHLEKQSESLMGQDVFCCLGSTIRSAGSQAAFRSVDFTYVVQAASLAAANGAEQFLLVSSGGANKNSRVFYLRVKGEVEEALAVLPFRELGIFRPSVLVGSREHRRLGETLSVSAMKLASVFMIGGLRKYRPIEAKTVAQAMLKAARQHNAGTTIYESDQIQKLGQA